MLQCLCPLQQIIVRHFFEPLMDDKNLIIEAQMVKALFVLQILDGIIMITFTLIQEKGFTESLLNWKTSTGPNSAPFLYYTNFGNGKC